MLSGFFSQKSINPPTRLENCLELKQIVPLLQRLRNKEAELKTAANANGSGSVDYRKYLVLTVLMKDVNFLVENFNKKAIPINTNLNIQDCIELVAGLGEAIKKVGERYGRNLNEARSNYKELANSSVYYGAYTVTVATSLMLPITSIGRIVTFFYLAPKVSHKVGNAVGKLDNTSATIKLLKEFVETLQRVFNNLNFAKNTGFAAIANGEEDVEQRGRMFGRQTVIIEEYIEASPANENRMDV